MPDFLISGPGNLLQRVSEALRALPGARERYVFGSIADGTADAYSDIDLEVMTQDVAASEAALDGVLNAVAPIEVDWQIPAAEDAPARTILFRGETYYHKLDIGLRDFGQIQDAALNSRKSGIALWRREAPAYRGQCSSDGVYAPMPGTPGHFAVGQLLGGIRYVKARKRGQNWTCWRFASAQIEWLASMLLELSRNWADLGRKLTTWEYIELDALMQKDNPRIPHSVWNFSCPASMDDGFCIMLDRTVALAREKAENLGETFPHDIAERLMHFIRIELDQNSEYRIPRQNED